MKRPCNNARHPLQRFPFGPMSLSSPSTASLPRICFLSYPKIRALAEPIAAEYRDRAQIDILDGSFEDALRIAREQLDAGAVDAFVSAGSNAAILRAHLKAPVATIQVGGFDILQALIQASATDQRVGMVTYGATIPALEAVKKLLSVEVRQYAYTSPDDARERFERLRAEGFQVIVGSSLVVELAEKAGLRGILVYSREAIQQAFEESIELARVARLEGARYEQLNGVLRTMQDAVLAVDREHRVVAINPPMQQLLGPARGPFIGRELDALESELSLRGTLDSGIEERGTVLRFSQRDWIAHRVPIRERGVLAGAAITLCDAHSIQEADTRLRIQQRRGQAHAQHRFDSLLGESPALQASIARARRFAKTDLTVLIEGESGSGKELFAQAIHNESARAGRPFVAINCASFAESLLESELFGHEEGAFTGSRRGGKRGLFEAAHTGTLFLDEIGDMPLYLQTRLLRVLQEREITRLGATSAIPIDVRVISATHQPLQEMVAARRFRQDLYYRINTLRLVLPPLRERGGDIEVLVTRAVERCLRRLGFPRDPQEALAPVMARLRAYEWPGNVRELENIAERMALLISDAGLQPEQRLLAMQHECPELFDAPRPEATARPQAAPGMPMRERIDEALRMANGNRQAAAEALGVSRSTLWRWLRDAAP